MTAPAPQSPPKRRLLLASDRSDQSSELASILQMVGEVDTISMADLPDAPSQFTGIVVDINLRSPECVQLVRNKLRSEPYRAMPRLFVLADALHHGSMQAWALGATDTIARPFDARELEARVEALLLRFQRSKELSPMLSGQPTVGRARRTVAVYSPKGGVGTTTIAVNLAVTAAQKRPDRKSVV